MSPRVRSVTPGRLVEEIARCAAVGEMPDRLVTLWERFGAFVGERGATALVDVSPAIADAFVRAPLLSGRPATLPTQHERRTSVRLLYRTARRLGLAEGDPTLDLRLPARTSSASRPLTDDEVELCRDVALWSASPRAAVGWALAECTARGAELAAITASDIDIDGRVLRIHGGRRTLARSVPINDWAATVLRPRLVTGRWADTRLVYQGADPLGAGQVATCRLITAVLLRAGLVGEPDVRPGSVAAWAARRVFDATGRIEGAAALLGVSGLDRAARIIGWDPGV